MTPAAAESTCMMNESTFTILLGRHKEAFSHEGNKRFRAIVKTYAAKYNEAKGRHEKSQITSFLLAELEEQGALFLQKNVETNTWERMPRRTVVAKIGHAIRDATVRYCKKQERGKKKKGSPAKTDVPALTKETITPLCAVTSFPQIAPPERVFSAQEPNPVRKPGSMGTLLNSGDESTTTDSSARTGKGAATPKSSELVVSELVAPEPVSSGGKADEFVSPPKPVTFPFEGQMEVTPEMPLIDFLTNGESWVASGLPAILLDQEGALVDFPTAENWDLLGLPAEDFSVPLDVCLAPLR